MLPFVTGNLTHANVDRGTGTAGPHGFRILLGERDSSLLENVQTDFGSRPASYLISTGVISQG